METLLTVEQTAERLQLSPLTVQRQLKRGALRGIKRGRVWRVPESALLESSHPVPFDSPQVDTPQARAAAILADLQSGNTRKRNAAIISLARCGAGTRALVEREVEKSVASYTGPEDDLSDWRALDGEPFHFAEEPADFLRATDRKKP
jgi:excisionase family DNA binding protein